MANLMRLDKIDGTRSLAFYCGELPVDDAITAAGHEPNGYFWEGVASYIAADMVGRLELDSEGGMFCAYGKARHLKRLRAAMEPYLGDPRRVAALIQEAEAAGFEFGD